MTEPRLTPEGRSVLTLTLPTADWQLLMQVCQQAMLPYQRLGQVLQAMQQQAVSESSQPAEGPVASPQGILRPNGEDRAEAAP